MESVYTFLGYEVEYLCRISILVSWHYWSNIERILLRAIFIEAPEYELLLILLYKSYQITKPKHFLSRLAVGFAQSIEARC